MQAHIVKTGFLGSMIALAGTFGLALVAHAGEATTATTARHADVVVRYADLDLESPEGAEALYARLSTAAGRACGNEPSTRELKARRQYEACYERTLEKAIRKVGNAGVQAVHAVRTGAATVG